MFKPDLKFSQELMKVVGDYVENKILSEQEETWCRHFRHMILQHNWENSLITDSSQLAITIQTYSAQALKREVYVLGIKRFRRTKYHMLKKQFDRVIESELTGALLRDIQKRDDFFKKSKDAQEYKKLLESNQTLSGTIEKTQKLLREREDELMDERIEVSRLEKDNQRLQTQLSEALKELDQVQLDVIRLKKQVALLPDLQKELKNMRHEIRNLKSGQETLSKSVFIQAPKSYPSDLTEKIWLIEN